MIDIYTGWISVRYAIKRKIDPVKFNRLLRYCCVSVVEAKQISRLCVYSIKKAFKTTRTYRGMIKWEALRVEKRNISQCNIRCQSPDSASTYPLNNSENSASSTSERLRTSRPL